MICIPIHVSGQYESNILLCDASNVLNDNNFKRELERAYREINKYTLSDSLWKMWNDIVDSQFVVPRVDSISALRKLAYGSQKAQSIIKSMNNDLSKVDNKIDINRVTLKYLIELEKVRIDLEDSIKLNPYDHRAQKYLIWIYQKLAELHASQENYKRSTKMLENLAYLVKNDSQLHFNLGENYIWLKKWTKARENLQKSINIILDTDWETINTDELFFHYSLRAEAEINLKLVPEALLTLHYAKLIAPSVEYEHKIEKQINWIKWDNGNIENSKRYDDLKMMFIDCQDFQKLKVDFLNLMDNLTTTSAKNEILWQISKLEFQYLDKKLPAIDRLFSVIKHIELDSTGAAVKIEFQKYLNDYGLMCYYIGVSHIQSNDYKLAYIYFYQSISCNWNGIGKSHLQLAHLTSINNDETIEFCNRALKYKKSLSLSEINQIFTLLFESYKSKGDFDKANEWYQRLASTQ